LNFKAIFVAINFDTFFILSADFALATSSYKNLFFSFLLFVKTSQAILTQPSSCERKNSGVSSFSKSCFFLKSYESQTFS